MVVNKILETLSFLEPRKDDDIFDRLSYYYTTVLLIMFAILVSLKQYGGHPLECWVDASYTGGWEQYAEMYCWAKNTYFVPFTEGLPDSSAERTRREVSYYQWFPFILLFQALCFYMPCVAWRLMSNKSGFNIDQFVKRACEHENIDPDKRSSNIRLLCRHLVTVLAKSRNIGPEGHQRGHRGMMWCFNLRFYHGYVTLLFLSVKVMYCFNLVLQLYLMNLFLQTGDSGVYGINVISSLLRGESWHASGHFPRVTMCDFQIRLLGNIQNHSVQCVLVINIFTEKIFIVLWFWFVILAIASWLALLAWCWALVVPWGKQAFLHRHMDFCGDVCQRDRRVRDTIVRKFLHNFVKTDGLFLLSMVTNHAGALLCTELVEAVWEAYQQQQENDLNSLTAGQGQGTAKMAAAKPYDPSKPSRPNDRNLYLPALSYAAATATDSSTSKSPNTAVVTTSSLDEVDSVGTKGITKRSHKLFSAPLGPRSANKNPAENRALLPAAPPPVMPKPLLRPLARNKHSANTQGSKDSRDRDQSILIIDDGRDEWDTDATAEANSPDRLESV